MDVNKHTALQSYCQQRMQLERIKANQRECLKTQLLNEKDLKVELLKQLEDNNIDKLIVPEHNICIEKRKQTSIANITPIKVQEAFEQHIIQSKNRIMITNQNELHDLIENAIRAVCVRTGHTLAIKKLTEEASSSCLEGKKRKRNAMVPKTNAISWNDLQDEDFKADILDYLDSKNSIVKSRLKFNQQKKDCAAIFKPYEPAIIEYLESQPDDKKKTQHVVMQTVKPPETKEEANKIPIWESNGIVLKHTTKEKVITKKIGMKLFIPMIDRAIQHIQSRFSETAIYRFDDEIQQQILNAILQEMETFQNENQQTVVRETIGFRSKPKSVEEMANENRLNRI